MSSKDQDLLDKLFEVEKKAEALVADARKEADSRIAAAKEKAEREIAEAHEAAVKAANERKSKEAAASIAEYEKAVADYKAVLDATRVDLPAFRALCEAALAKK